MAQKLVFSYRLLLLSILCTVFMLFFMSSHRKFQAITSEWSTYKPGFAINNRDIASSSIGGTLYPNSSSTLTVTHKSFADIASEDDEKFSELLDSTSPNSTIQTNHPTTLLPPCKPMQQIVFIKTHKTGSTTMASIFERYGYYRNLTFVVGRSHILSFPAKFSHKSGIAFPGMKGKPFNILTNHARYNHKEMDMVVPKATFITIIRKPEDQLDSAFGYFEMYKGMGLQNRNNPLKAFMDNPMKYFKERKYRMQYISRNGQLFDLGFDPKYNDNETKILKKVAEIEKDFNLVMITEYFDESLILMKKVLCWEFDDILYITKGVRSVSHRFEIDDDLSEKLRTWNHGDVLLYNHFNKTFWKKIAEYGPAFERDLQHFRNMNTAVFDECINLNTTNNKDRRVNKFVLKNKSERCEGMLRGDLPYTSLIRKSMVKRFGIKPK